MDLGRGRVTSRNGVVAGSVWESRMKIDEVKGGIKVFNGDEKNPDENNGLQVYKRMRPKQGPIGKRKTWKSETSEGNPIQIAKQRSELTPIHTKRTRSISQKGITITDSTDGMERNSVPLRKAKSESNKGLELDESGDGTESNVELRKEKSEGNKVLDEPGKSPDELGNGIEKMSAESTELLNAKFESNKGIEGKNPIGVMENGTMDEFGGCEEKVITSNLSNDDEEDWDEELKEEVEDGIGIEIEIEKKSCDVKEINIQEQKQKKVVIEEKIIHPNSGKPLPFSPIVRKQQKTPVVNHPKIIPKPTKTKPIPISDEFKRVPKTHSNLQSLVDLVMWRDVSKSAFVFGIGTFIIISSSYTGDLNISFISVVSYLGLVYLAAIFFFRSIICRGAIDIDDTRENHVVGEEEAVWLLKLILPYLNEFLLKLRALFSGDPSTTMKLAVLLFVLARCGSSITIWKMAKLGFFGVFTLPKVCCSYSTQLTGYGTFWIRRFRDAWESCSHKKAVAFAIFTLVWNLSSIVARIWAVFMLFVAFRYYQHSLMREDWVEEEANGGEDSWQGQIGEHRPRRGPTSVEINKQKKRY